ncbi:TonB-dependent receptor plug domain-containing protein [Compostibacter hankyongensis]|uniref:TonB-dependent receptor plug domain-containing protein n=1 Tax=Compostibacter hankyongensis TaxID=1007089 RepID=A0ABP8FN30_9BACT
MCCTAAIAQDASKSGVGSIFSDINTFTQRQQIEKLYLQTDKPAYAAGDTLWFKGYLLEADYLYACEKSRLLYVEITDDSNHLARRIMVPVINGLAAGSIALDHKDFPQGGYVIRAYTNWMRNFGTDYIFKKHFYLSAAGRQDWLVSYRSGTGENAGRTPFELQLRHTDGSAVVFRQLQLRITDGKKTELKQNVRTGVDGRLSVNAELPGGNGRGTPTLWVQDLQKNGDHRKIAVPLLLNRPAFTGLRFMPEGGSLVAGLPAHVIVRAENEAGLAAAVSGHILDDSSRVVATFRTGPRGTGAFDFVPRPGKTYTARLQLPDSVYKRFPLPPVKSSGTTLEVHDRTDDSCEIVIRATPDVAAAGHPCFLIGMARGVPCFGASFPMERDTIGFTVSKKVFPDGIARILLSGPGRALLNERSIFINHSDHLRIRIRTDKTVYRPRERVDLHITVTDKQGSPVQGSFSLAVTDDGQVKTDPVRDGTILTSMLLTSDLREKVEDPGYYLQDSAGPVQEQDLDRLLLTTTVTGPPWADISGPEKPFAYAAEQEFLIRGKVTNMFNKPVARSPVALLSRKPLLVMDTVTDREGLFTFKGIVPVDTASFFIQSRNKKGKSFNVGIEMDEFKPPVFTAPRRPELPWYVNVDTVQLTRLNRKLRMQEQQEKISGGILLKPVVVNAKKIIKDSKNLNGPGEADITVDEQELEKAGRTTLGDLLEKHIPGFGVTADKHGRRYYRIQDKRAHLIIDGTDVEFFLPPGISLYDYFKQYLDYYDAEEIKGIEVMSSSRYTGSYFSQFLNPLDDPLGHAFIEITTRGGRGPFVKKSVGTYLYKPMPFTLPQPFHAPEYPAGSSADGTDIRSTIYWAPDIVTDTAGQATLHFYTADSPGTYSLILEGSDMRGGLGTGRTRITVQP